MDAAIADESLGVIHQAAVDAGFVDNESEGQAAGSAPNAPTSMPSAAENMPLEPGSAAPNLDEMVQRASQQLNETHAKLSASAPGEPVADGDMDHKNGDERASGDLRPDGPPDVAFRPASGEPVVTWAYNNGTDHDIAIASATTAGWSQTLFLTSSVADERTAHAWLAS